MSPRRRRRRQHPWTCSLASDANGVKHWKRHSVGHRGPGGLAHDRPDPVTPSAYCTACRAARPSPEWGSLGETVDGPGVEQQLPLTSRGLGISAGGFAAQPPGEIGGCGDVDAGLTTASPASKRLLELDRHHTGCRLLRCKTRRELSSPHEPIIPAQRHIPARHADYSAPS